MSATETRGVIDRYFEIMGRGEDFASCYAEDVRWTTFDGETLVVWPDGGSELPGGAAQKHAGHPNPAA